MPKLSSEAAKSHKKKNRSTQKKPASCIPWPVFSWLKRNLMVHDAGQSRSSNWVFETCEVFIHEMEHFFYPLDNGIRGWDRVFRQSPVGTNEITNGRAQAGIFQASSEFYYRRGNIRSDSFFKFAILMLQVRFVLFARWLT